MNLDRLRQLEQYAKEDPDDPFPRYALALEWMHSDSKKALELFAQVLRDHPDYLPAYYHAGQLTLDAGDSPGAKLILEKGILLAAATGDPKTKAELSTLLDGI